MESNFVCKSLKSEIKSASDSSVSSEVSSSSVSSAPSSEAKTSSEVSSVSGTSGVTESVGSKSSVNVFLKRVSNALIVKFSCCLLYLSFFVSFSSSDSDLSSTFEDFFSLSLGTTSSGVSVSFGSSSSAGLAGAVPLNLVSLV